MAVGDCDHWTSMPRFRLPASGALVIAVAGLALSAAGCNSGGHRAATPPTGTPGRPAPCKLSSPQRHTVALALTDIRRLRRIQAPMQSFSQHGAPNQNEVTGKLMLDLGSTTLPPNVFAHLLHLAKTATSLCGDCGRGLEADEPFLNNRQASRCG